ncbi:MAG: NYN domain-containing protein [Acidimicrobiales bacterium]
MARAGEAAAPPQPAPPILRRYLRFARLPAPALDIARRALEDDPAFRERVAAALTQAEVGEAGWLWLSRPDGWEERVAALRQAAQDRARSEREDSIEQNAQRRLVHAEDRARRSEALVAALERELAATRADLADERAARQAVEREADAIVAEARELLEQRQAAVRRLKAAEAELAAKRGDLKQLRLELRARDVELDELRTPAPATTVQRPDTPERDAALSAAVGRAASAAEQLSSALTQASSLLAPTASPPSPQRRRAPDAPTTGRHAARRSPAALPPGVLDDGPEAAEHLLRAPTSMLVVDGYNISMAIWGSHPIAMQRARLVDALAELHDRTGTDVEVVFDGAEPIGPVVPAAARAGVRVRFSPPDVEADDVVLERLDTLPTERCVVVASSDARVREGARRRGASVLSAPQLIAAMRR